MRVGDETLVVEPELVPLRLDRLRFVGFRNPGHIFFNHGWTRMDTDREGSYDDAFPFQFRVLEIPNQANPKLCDSQIIHHLAALVVGNSVNDLSIDDDSSKSNETGNEFADLHTAKHNGEPPLLIKRDVGLVENDRQGVLVNLLVQTVAHPIQDVERVPDDLLCFFLK